MEINRCILSHIKNSKNSAINLYGIYNTAKTILVFSPHADDEIISCGGSLLWHSTHLHSIFIYYMTDEKVDDLNDSTRRKETKKIIQYLNAKKFYFGANEFEIKITDKLVLSIAEYLLEIKPDLIYSPSPWETHPDHYKTYELFYNVATYLLKNHPNYNCSICFYEIWNNGIINSYFNITNYWSKKVQLLNTYQSQQKYHIYELSKAMNQLSALRFLQRNNQFAESFHLCKLCEIIEFNNIYFLKRMSRKKNDK